MKPELQKAQWTNYLYSNSRFMRGTPRDTRQAFGSSLEIDRPADTWVVVVVVACFIVGALITWGGV